MILIQHLKEWLPVIKYSSEDIVFAAGSLIEGMGNVYSDIDIYVICSDIPKNISHPEYKVDMVKHNDNIIDIDYVLLSDFELLISRLLMVTEDNGVGILTGKEKRLLHRFLNGEILVNENKYRHIYELINYDQFIMTMVQELEIEYRDLREDLLGNLADNRLQTAYINALSLLKLSIKLTLLTLGESNPSDKWRYEKLKKLSIEDYNAYWSIQITPIESIEEVKLISDWLEARHLLIYSNIEIYLPLNRRGKPYDGHGLY
ncbi:hypothetical protein J7E78_05275 [Paenibacillus polymyxa]|uniref:hypothetical protein n=1 Tax=Paenibacillus polymyxa TaxID=1406 RepID=UPI001BE700EB|nr:hypothetical protein [Paenibacillus polymyxa]MBT2282949.1 hypothetical protein [Paenibacillus polymyxa]